MSPAFSFDHTPHCAAVFFILNNVGIFADTGLSRSKFRLSPPAFTYCDISAGMLIKICKHWIYLAMSPPAWEMI